ncbi:MAG TPA: hypothetical protein VI306_17470 [Pyrinomonadaceae bacterium]
MADDSLSHVAVLEWQAWKGFLLLHVLGDSAIRIETDPFSEFPAEQFDYIFETCSAVCWQINLSVRGQLPLQIRELTNRFTERGLYVVNGIVQDIRKSTLQAHLETVGLPSLRATPDGPAEEMLFVKTNLNYGGEVERWLPVESVAAGKLERLVSNDFGAYRYKTIQRRFIKEELWNDPALVIERYVTNNENSFYRVYFSGGQVVIVKAFAPGVIKKLSGDDRDTNFVTDLEHLKDGTDQLPLNESLKRDVAIFIDTAPVEFGSLDIVHDGQHNNYIIDLNLTPYAGTRPHDPFLVSFLKLGITDPDCRKALQSNSSPLAGELRSTTATS